VKPRPVVAPRTLGTVFTSEASTVALAGDDARVAKLAVGCALSDAD
jgi:hypothetical protein